MCVSLAPYQASGCTRPSPLEITIGVHSYLQEKRMLYERELMAIMTQFEVFNEAEVVSGCISKFAKHKRKPGDVKAIVIHEVQGLRRHIAQLRSIPVPTTTLCTHSVAAARVAAQSPLTLARELTCEQHASHAPFRRTVLA